MRAKTHEGPKSCTSVPDANAAEYTSRHDHNVHQDMSRINMSTIDITTIYIKDMTTTYIKDMTTIYMSKRDLTTTYIIVNHATLRGGAIHTYIYTCVCIHTHIHI